MKHMAAMVAATTLLAGCNGGMTPATNAGGVAGASPFVARHALGTTHADRSRSWMLPAAKKATLLYVSDVGTDDVYVYAYPNDGLVGTLTGFDEPQGLCSDRDGNVWVANTGTAQVFEYSHGGTSRVATLRDPGQYPSGCAVDSAGDVAVTNVTTTHGGRGSIAWYAGGNGKARLITSPDFREMYFDGFDDSGNLFIDGWPHNFARAELGELAAGSKKIVPIAVDGATIGYPGGVQVVGNSLNVGDQVNDAVFQMTEGGTVTGYVPLDGAFDCVQGTIFQKTFVCPDSLNAAVEFFHYPAGGAPARVISNLSEPTGSALSK